MQIEKLRGKELDQLFEAVLSLQNMDECYRFFDDLCTVNEIQSLAQRLEVARMLKDGNTYHKIETETGASTATISRVKRCLNYGNDAYVMALARVQESKQEASVEGSSISKG
ncbi:YerC/YecD family TrpR-related protein [Bacillus fonticola]|uniref:YerC/YecD family TrpR-related protein n=1 Tax=Bacillus fonticola TaxID=2728853 RepID=UPI001472C391|nr:YerC/YecD family TrpR-related protein [Bacillus fonticola]